MKRYAFLAAGVAALLMICGGAFWVFKRSDISTRVVCTDGRVCTEYFGLKDGLPVDSVCPSEGGERYPLPDGCTRTGNDCRCR